MSEVTGIISMQASEFERAIRMAALSEVTTTIDLCSRSTVPALRALAAASMTRYSAILEKGIIYVSTHVLDSTRNRV